MKPAIVTVTNSLHGFKVGDYVCIDTGPPRFVPRWVYRLWRKIFKPKALLVTHTASTTFEIK